MSLFVQRNTLAAHQIGLALLHGRKKGPRVSKDRVVLTLGALVEPLALSAPHTATDLRGNSVSAAEWSCH